MAILHPAPVASSKFTWSKGTQSFIAEASDLGYRAGQSPFGQVYDDAIDEGLTLVSSKYPGKEIVFVVDKTDIRDGDILAWHLIPANLAERKTVKFGVTIFND